MGEAKRRKKMREEAALFCKPLKRARFNLLAIGARSSRVVLIVEELSWWASRDERVIGFVSRDKIDNDYSWMILARDRVGRFRCVDCKVSYKTERSAEDALHAAIADTVKNKDITALGD